MAYPKAEPSPARGAESIEGTLEAGDRNTARRYAKLLVDNRLTQSSVYAAAGVVVMSTCPLVRVRTKGQCLLGRTRPIVCNTRRGTSASAAVVEAEASVCALPAN